VAAATQMEGYETLTKFIPGFAGHAVAMFLGMVFIGLGQRLKKAEATTE
jgi:hypothetical protein